MQATKTEILLDQIAHHLVIHTSFITNLGLFHGKIGIILFFCHYARHKKNTIYEDFAGELLTEVYEEIDNTIPIGMEAGLCGIGWGIEYLLQNNFMPGDSGEILSEINQQIMAQDIRRITDNSFQTGMAGISHYIQIHLNSPCRDRSTQAFDDLYLAEWKSLYEKQQIKQIKITDLLTNLLKSTPEGEDFINWELGLENGCAGWGLKKMSI